MFNPMTRHKVFISFKYSEHYPYKDMLIDWNERYNLFENLSVGEGEIDDRLPDEKIRQKIRNDFIGDATVLILLNGSHMRKSKFIDWELHAAMTDTPNNPKMGILVINLPDNNDGVIENLGKGLPSSGYNDYNFFQTESNLDYENLLSRYPNSPTRLLKNIIRDDVKIKMVNWNDLSSPENIKYLVHEAFLNRKNNQYDHSDPLRKRAYQ